MSAKMIIGLALVAVAIIAPEVIPGILGVAAGSTVALVATAAVEIGISLAESKLQGSAPNLNAAVNNQVSRLYASLSTTAARVAVLGQTAFATDVRYDTYTGAKQEHYQQIIGCACHKVQSIDQIWLDNELAWTSAGGVQGRYVGYLSVTAITEGTPTNGIAIDATWTAQCTLTGCAYVHLDHLLIGPNASTPSPFQSGVTNRITIIGKGALLYDVRKDSTVAGGSGAHRADDQSTWEWDDNACRNPALQELFYELGWRINGVLSVGKGLPPSRLRLADYITAANICDEAVALKAGGTEPRYRSDGVISEGDASKTCRDAICATMNAELRDFGSGISVQILHDDLADVVADFGADDILQDGDYDEAVSLDEYFNIVRGRCVDPSTNSLYQLTDYPEQSVASPDGVDRIEPFDLPMVQSATQAQRLAKLHLMRKQSQGTYDPTLGPRAWRTSIGRNVSITHPVLPWSSKIFRTATQSVNKGGPTKLTLIEENSSIYAWDPATDERAPITAGVPTVYDPNNNPLLATDTSGILRASYPKGLRATGSDGGSSATITLDGGSAGAAFVIDYDTQPPVDVSVPAGALTSLPYATDLYLYADVAHVLDPAPTYGATSDYGTALNSATHPLRIYLNQFVPTPIAGGGSTSGGGGGGGYGGGTVGSCPWAEAMVHTRRGWLRAADVVVGDEVLVLADDRSAIGGWEAVTSNDAGEETCYTIKGETSEIAVIVSESTPITLQDGTMITVAEIDGHELPFERGDDFWWEPCSIMLAGVLPVQHIKCNDKTYSAGNVRGAGILTHNPKP